MSLDASSEVVYLIVGLGIGAEHSEAAYQVVIVFGRLEHCLWSSFDHCALGWHSDCLA